MGGRLNHERMITEGRRKAKGGHEMVEGVPEQGGREWNGAKSSVSGRVGIRNSRSEGSGRVRERVRGDEEASRREARLGREKWMYYGVLVVGNGSETTSFEVAHS